MSRHLPAIKPRQLISALNKAGWYAHRQKGSHIILHNAGSKSLLVIPMHNRDIPDGTLRSIISDANLSVDEFIELLKK